MASAQDLIKIAASQIGVNDKGNNDVLYNDWYYGKHVSGNAYPWCCTFVSWCCYRAGVTIPGYGEKGYASCAIFTTGKSLNKAVKKTELQPGDLVFFNFNTNNAGFDTRPIQHVGIVEKVNSKNITTIEGNTSSTNNANGGNVERKTRYYGNIVGGVRLPLTNTSEASTGWSSGGFGGSFGNGNMPSTALTSPSENNKSPSQSVIDYGEHIYKSIVAPDTGKEAVDTSKVISRTKGKNLLSYPSLVESPFIILTVGEHTFGSYTKSSSVERSSATATVTYPNFMDSISIVKVNGAVNTYNIKMIYQIQAGDDPNLLDKVFSSISDSREVKISYGDWMSPNFIYKDEKAIITKIQSNIDVASSKITYTITCVSSALALTGSRYDFPATTKKPSDVIRQLLSDTSYGLKTVFTGMNNNQIVANLKMIPGDDKAVQIDAKHSIDVISYINYLVSCMICNTNTSTGSIKDSTYHMTIYDDYEGEAGGPYFKITKTNVSANREDTTDTYVVDIGYPGDNFVTGFTVNNDDSWSILYNYSEAINRGSYTYKVGDDGKIYTELSPNLTTSGTYFRTTAPQQTWWTQVTQFPISATLTLKGLVRPAVLMNYVRIRVYFYGQKHISSGLYIITKQEDIVNSNGYKTILGLTRVGGGDAYLGGASLSSSSSNSSNSGRIDTSPSSQFTQIAW